jgi:uncharacterized membrane protein YkoI
MKKLILAAAALLLTTSSAFADGDNKVEKQAKIPREEAKKIALKEVPGTITDCDIEKRKTGLFWYIDVKPTNTTGIKKEVKLDANTGAVLSVKEEPEDDDDKD